MVVTASDFHCPAGRGRKPCPTRQGSGDMKAGSSKRCRKTEGPRRTHLPANFLGTMHERQVSLDFVPLPLNRSVCPCLNELDVSLGEERHGGTWHPLRLTKAPVIGPNPRIYGCG